MPFTIILAMLWVISSARADEQETYKNDSYSTLPLEVMPDIYLPISMKNYCSIQEVPSPFSIEIAALNQITVTNIVGQEAYPMQVNQPYDQVYTSLLAALQDSGAGWTRVVINWSEIEPEDPLGQDPVYKNLYWYDSRLSQISQIGVKIIAVINGAPNWANDGYICPAVNLDHISEYQQFLDFIVSRYSQPPYNIKTWEIFNEADNTTKERAASHACFGRDTFEYKELITSSYTTIKNIDSSATVLMSGIAYENWDDYQDGVFYRYFPDEIMGVAAYFDALNFHYFPDFHAEWERWNPPAQPTCSEPPGESGFPSYYGGGIDVIAKKNFFTNRMDVCQDVIKPVWLTEFGEHGWHDDDGSKRNQAYYVMKGYSRSLAAGIKNITWYALANPPDDVYDQSLLIYEPISGTFTTKPAFYAYKTLVAQLTNYKYDRLISLPGVEAYVFTNSCQEEKIIAWGNDTTIPISPAHLLEVTDYSGSITSISDGGIGDMDGTVNGSIAVMLSMDPMTGSTRIDHPVPIPVYIQVLTP